MNVREAGARLSELIKAAEAGEEIVLARAGKPVARIVPVRRVAVRRLGRWKGKVSMAGHFDAPLDATDLGHSAGRD